MSGQTETIYRLQRGDAQRAGVVMAEAFREDPVWGALFGSAATLEQRQAAFETPVIYCRKYGEVWASSQELEGIAAWVPGRYARMTILRMILSGAIRAGLAMGTQLGRKMEPVFRPMEADRDEHMKGRPYLYLQLLGVAPSQQGQGHGGKLLRALIGRCERDRLPLYLETETERNVSMYTHFGFRVLKQITLPVVNLPMWELVRETAATSPEEEPAYAKPS